VDGREWNDNPVHDEVDGDAVEEAGDDGATGEEAQFSAGQKEYCGGAEGDEEMKRETERGGRRTAPKRSFAQQAARDPLQHPERAAVTKERDDDGGRDVQNAAEQATQQQTSDRFGIVN